MTGFLVSLVAVLGFAAGLYFSGIVGTARRVIAQANAGLSAMLDSALSDDDKEAAVRKAGIALVLGSGSLLWRLILCLLAAALPLWGADLLGIAVAQDVLDLMLRLDYIIGVSLVLIVLVWLLKRRAGPSETGVVSQASNTGGDRFLHMLAFSGGGIQRLMTRLENLFFGRAAAGIPDRPPVLITSLARGGTTAVLNALNDVPQTVTLTYREMPFVTAPLLWNRLSAPLKRKVEKQKRAHGDGLSIDLDSPEAFDEVYWKLYWPEKYEKDRIALWTGSDLKPEARSFFLALARKLTLVRRLDAARYLSKNNANIARLALLPKMFEACDIVVPLRHPAAHANSLLRQHENFLKQQTEDEFTKRYMRDIGHLEFGLLHKPIGFEGFDKGSHDPRSANYWLAYWIAGFAEVQRHAENCHIIVQDDLRRTPVQTMQALCRRLEMETGEVDFARYFRSTPDETDASVFDPDLLAQAEQIYQALAARAVQGDTPRSENHSSAV